MATSQVEIVNRALDMLGTKVITSIDDELREARMAKRRYPGILDAMLRAHPWNFAIKRLALAPSDTTPVYGFDYKFQLPSDCIRILDTYPENLKYQIEEGFLLADSNTVHIKYIYRVADPNLFDTLFTEAFAARIAYELSLGLTQDTTLSSRMWDVYQLKLAEARSVNGQEDTAQELEEFTGPWLDIRS